MTDDHTPSDETQPHATAGVGTDGGASSRTGAADPGSADPGAADPGATAAAHRLAADQTDAADPTRSTEGSPADGLRADPARPAASGWREPVWFPPRERERRASPVAIVFGIGLIALGLYFFADRTLGITLPRIQWSTVWPVVLIVLGGLVLVRSVNRRS